MGRDPSGGKMEAWKTRRSGPAAWGPLRERPVRPRLHHEQLDPAGSVWAGCEALEANCEGSIPRPPHVGLARSTNTRRTRTLFQTCHRLLGRPFPSVKGLL